MSGRRNSTHVINITDQSVINQAIFAEISQALLDFDRSAAEQIGVLDRCFFINAAAEDLSAIESESVDVGNWVTNSISSGARPIRRMDSEVRIHGENGVDDISAGTADAPGVGALAE
jgi:hypothetical protein